MRTQIRSTHAPLRRTFPIIILFLATALASAQHSPPIRHRTKTTADGVTRHGLNARRGAFVENRGQWDRSVHFATELPGMNFWLTSTGFVVDVHRDDPSAVGQLADSRRFDDHAPREFMRRGAAVRFEFIGAEQHAVLSGRFELPGKLNYFVGNDATRWGRDARRFGGVDVTKLYAGVDAALLLDGGRPRYDLMLAPGVPVGRIRMAVTGGDRPRVARNGELVVATPVGEVRQSRPIAFQMIDGKCTPVRCSFEVHEDGTVGFALGAYDRTRPLTIDPIVYATFLGGSAGDNIYGRDFAQGVDVDASRNAYVTGFTYCTNFPVTAGAYSTTLGATYNAFVAKVNPTGTGFVYATYLGGAASAMGNAIDVDSAGNAFITGRCGGGFPTTAGAPQANGLGGPTDAFITKLNASGNGLVYSTYMGGGNDDEGLCITTDAAGNAYVGGRSRSSNFPTTAGAYDVTYNTAPTTPWHSTVTKINAAGTAWSFSTWISGTSSEDYTYGIAVDASGNVFAAGTTYNGDFPTTVGAYDRTNGAAGSGTDGWVAKFNPTGSTLLYSTFIGGNATDFTTALSINANGEAYILGYTDSQDFPTTPGAFRSTPAQTGIDDLTVTKLNATGSALLYATYLGANRVRSYGMALDDGGGVYGCGWIPVGGAVPTTAGTYQNGSNGREEAFVFKFVPATNTLSYGSYFGGSFDDRGRAVAVDNNGDAYLVGEGCYDIAVSNTAADASSGGTAEGFLAKFPIGLTKSLTLTAPNSGAVACGTATLPITWTSTGINAVKIELSSDAGATWPTTIIAATPAAAGTYTWTIPATVLQGNQYRIRVTDTASTSFRDASDSNITMNRPPIITAQPSARTTCQGVSTSFTVAATGATFTYQWRRNGANIPGATTATYTLASPQPADTGLYDVVVQGPACSIASNAVRLTVNTPPNITTEPRARTVCAGEAARFSVAATGTAATYQWQKNGTNITGATDTAFAINTAQTADAGTYRVIVSGACSPPDTSAAVALVVNTAPNVTADPQDRTICFGDAVRFDASATGTALTYRWQKNGVDIPGATSASYTIASAQPTDAASYRVVISGTCSPPDTSAVARLTVNMPPSITTEPQPSTVCRGTATTFSVAATGTALAYQWQKNGTDIPGANGATHTLASPQPGDAGTYRVVVSGACAPNDTSAAVALVVNVPPLLTTEPPGRTVCQGSSTTFTATATGTGITYQWQRNGVNIPNATASTFTIASPQPGDAATYRVIVQGTCSPADTSLDALLTVNTPPEITDQPSPTARTLCLGESTTLTASATGTAITYQWRHNGAAIPGATAASYTLGNAQGADSGSYDVVVSGVCSPQAFSMPVSVRVNMPPSITVQPVATRTEICSGGSTTLTVAATGTGLTYQWRRNGTNLPGATSTTYAITGATAADNGQYDVVVGGACQPAVTSSSLGIIVNVPPSIVTGPSPAQNTLCEGESTSITVAAAGSGLTYQWRKDGVDIPGATSAAYSIPSALSTSAGTYDVVISGTCSPAVTSAAATLAVHQKPRITQEPDDISVCEGYPGTFHVSASGTGLSYQWRRNGAPIAGATGPSYTIAAPTAADATSYDVMIYGSCSPHAISKTVRLEIKNVPPFIVEPPLPRVICAGQPTAFHVEATGSSLSYQWFKDNRPIPGATTPTYSIGQTTASDSGRYHVEVSSACSSEKRRSEPVALTVNALPTISQPPQDQVVCSGDQLRLNVAASGTALRLQWRKNGTSIPGATSATLSIDGVTTAHAGRYDVVIAGDCGNDLVSRAATVVVNEPAVIVEQPTGDTVTIGAQVTFRASALGTDVHYQWRFNGTNIPGAAEPVYTIPSARKSDAGEYDVVVSGACPTVARSVAAVLVVNDPPLGVDVAVAGSLVMNIAPNPTSRFLSVTVQPRPTASRGLDLALFDMSGRRVLDLTEAYRNAGMGPVHADVHGLATGTYLCRLTVDGRTVVTRTVIVVN